MIERTERALRTSWIGLGINLVMGIFKLVAGVVGHSAAMVADGVHSMSDLATDVVAILGFRMVSKPVDESHGYGHGKFETLSSTIVGLFLLIVAAGIFKTALCRVVAVLRGEILRAPGMIALWAAVFSIGAKESLYRYTIRIAKKLNSGALTAQAWHHRSDALSSLGTFFGIAGAIFLGERARILDPLAGIVVSLVVARVAVHITCGAVNELMEASLPAESRKRIIEIALSVPGVRDAHMLRTRRIGCNVGMDFHILVDPSITIRVAHNIATEVENRLRGIFGKESFISVHVEPDERIPKQTVSDED